MDVRDANVLPTPSPAAVFRRTPEGGVLFSTDTEVYFGVGQVGADIWELLPPAVPTLDELVRRLSATYRDVTSDQIRADVERFLGELLENGLVSFSQESEMRDGSSGPSGS